jgi:AraC-like DNA-binding protein
MTISQLAKSFLSESRLRSLFRKVKGVPLHRYIIWNKILLAIGNIINGATVKDAATDCGFTDSSHFHKLLLGMFGVSPSQFIKDNSEKNFRILTPHPMCMESRIFDNESCNAIKTYKT